MKTAISLLSLCAFLSACSPNMPPPSAQPAAQSMPLAGSEWGIENWPDIFVQFQSGGTLIGHGGCNRFFGSYSQKGGALTLGPIGSTKMYCTPEIMDGESLILDALSQTENAKAAHMTLILRAADGTELLSLQRRDWD